MEEPQPIFASGYFFVRESGLIEQIVEFYYYDPSEIYKEIIANPIRLREEKRHLVRNMQSFLDQEEVKINGRRVYPRVVDLEIGIREDGQHPYISFFIIFAGSFKTGLNIYEDKYEPETVDYNYRVLWLFPTKSRIINVDVDARYSIMANGRILVFRVDKGTRVKGYEKIEFEMLT